jgi:hypothetical protein
MPGEVLGAAVAVYVAAVGWTAAQPESNTERERGQGVGDVVDGVGQQGDRTGYGHDDDLEPGGDAEATEADGQGPQAVSVGRRGIDAVGVVVAVGREHVADRAHDTTAISAGVGIVAVVVGGVGLMVSGQALRASVRSPGPMASATSRSM